MIRVYFNMSNGSWSSFSKFSFIIFSISLLAGLFTYQEYGFFSSLLAFMGVGFAVFFVSVMVFIFIGFTRERRSREKV